MSSALNHYEGLKRDYLDMLNRSIEEIQTLRATIDKLSPRAEAYDQIKKVLNLMPSNDRLSMSEDITWLMKKRLDEIQSLEVPVNSSE